MKAEPLDITILGAGSWGTAMAVLLAKAGRPVRLVPRRPEQALELHTRRENAKYLGGIPLPAGVHVSADLAQALAQSQTLLIATPAKGLRALQAHIAQAGGLRPDCLIVNLCKGIEPESQSRPGVFFQKAFPQNPYATLSGPNNALEVAQGKPAAAVLASDGHDLRATQALLNTPTFRVYRSQDLAGVEWGACLKNVYAIAIGIVDGLKLGDNARAALLTRAMAESVRIGKALGGQEATFYGLSGLGDFVATAFGPWSRNRSFGQAIGSGLPPQDILNTQQGVVEGYTSVAAFHALAQENELQAPILSELFKILYQGTPVAQSTATLLQRDLKAED